MRDMNEPFLKYLFEGTGNQVRKLGPLGTITYVGAILLFLVALFSDFKTESLKPTILAGVGAVLLLFSGIIYYSQTKEKAMLVKEALNVFSGVYNRLAEQISTANEAKTESITKTIGKNFPDKISEVIEKSSEKAI